MPTVVCVRAKHFFLTLVAIQLVACGGSVTVPEPHWRAEAFAAEQEGARRHARGDHAGAAQNFDDAERRFVAIDDAESAQRARRHQATARLAAGHAEHALALLDAAPATDIDAQRLRAQALLALQKTPAAQRALTAAIDRCGQACPQRVTLQLLGARIALAENRFADAMTLAQIALGALKGSENMIETANAHRLLAEARLYAGQWAAAMMDAEQALALDRQLALPEKIVRDWLLIGDIRMKAGAGNNAASGQTAHMAYQQARDIAAAAGLTALRTTADTALSKELK